MLEKDTPGFGLISMDTHSRVTGFVEKPKTAEEREPYFTSAEWIEKRGIACKGRHYLANMGIYLFKTDVLCELLTAKPLATDFGKEVFPRNYKTKKVHAHLFDGYWEDLGTIRSYHEASLALAAPEPAVRLLLGRWGDLHPDAEPAGQPDQRGRAGTQRRGGWLRDRKRLAHRTEPDRGAERDRERLRDSRHGDYRLGQVRNDRGSGRRMSAPIARILMSATGAVIDMAILDKDCRIGRGVKLINKERRQDADGPNGMYHIRDGIICIPRNTTIPDGTVI